MWTRNALGIRSQARCPSDISRKHSLRIRMGQLDLALGQGTRQYGSCNNEDFHSSQVWAVSITNDSGQRGKEKNSFKDEPLREREGGGGGKVPRAKAIWRNPRPIGWKVTLPVGSWTLLSQAARLALILTPYHFHHLWQKILVAFGDLSATSVWGPLWSVPLTLIPCMQRRSGRSRAGWERGYQAASKQKEKGEGRLGPRDGLPARSRVSLNIERWNKKKILLAHC